MERTHVIGNKSAYDADMSLIESFVRHKNDPNLINSTAVFNYYYSQLLNYWAKLLELLKNKDYVEKYKTRDTFFKSDIFKYRNKIRSEYYNLSLDDLSNAVEMGGNQSFDSLEQRYQLMFPIEYDGVVEVHQYRNGGGVRMLSKNHLYPTKQWSSIIETVIPGHEYSFIINNIETYEQRFFELLENLKKIFEKTKNVDLREIAFMFNFIAALMCNYPANEVMLVNSTYQYCFNYYIFPNNTGLFGLNTYLFAYFEGVDLIGAPSQVQSYDDITTCPSSFISHDFGHCESVRDVKNKPILKAAFYKILSSNYDTKLKELLILVMWIQIHELYLNFYIFTKYGNYNELYPSDNLEDIYFNVILNDNLPYVEEFYDEFKSFGDILFLPESSDLIFKYFPSFDPDDFLDKPIKYYHMLIMLYGYSFTKEYVL